MEVTPELTELLGDDAKEFVVYMKHTPKANVDRLHTHLSNIDIFTYVGQHIQGRRVADIGCGVNFQKKKDLMLNWGAEEFIVVDPDLALAGVEDGPGFSIENIDGYSWLKRQPDESCIVISSNTFVGGVIEVLGPRKFDYFRALCNQIHRVTPTGSITLHDMDLYLKNFLIRTGLKLDTSAPEPFNKLEGYGFLSFIK